MQKSSARAKEEKKHQDRRQQQQKRDNIQAPTHYKVLHLRRGATRSQIKQTWRIKAKKFHPDLNKGKNTTEMMQRINLAKDTLIAMFDSQQYNTQDHHPKRSEIPK